MPPSRTLNAGALEALERAPRAAKASLTRAFWYAIAIAILAWSWRGAEMRPLDLFRDAGNIATFAADFVSPNFHDWSYYLGELVVTLQIAVWGTVLAVIAAVPLGLLAASNVSPWWVHQPIRRLMDAFRAINEMVFAMLFVVAVGLGPFAGVLALFVHTTGIFAKLYSEAVEAIDPQPVEGIRATGAHVIEEVLYGIIPQVMPLWVSYTLYRFESNVRAATVVGMVGAGGIGVALWDSVRSFQFDRTSAVLIMIVATVTLVDLFSARVRKMFI